MVSKKLLVGAGLVLAAVVAAPIAAQAPAQSILAFADRVEATQPMDAEKLWALIGAPPQCNGEARPRNADCEAPNVKIGQVVVGALHFRDLPGGSMLVLEDLKGQCASVEALRQRFAANTIEQTCTDGEMCWYIAAKRPWGKVSIGLGDGAKPVEDCATSLVFNTFTQ